MSNLIGAISPNSNKRPRRRLLLIVLLPIFVIVLMGIFELIGIVRAQVILNNAVLTAGGVTITGQYDTKMFSNIDAAWTPQDGPDHDGIPCPMNADDPAQEAFKSHWGMPCDPTLDDDQLLRKDIFRLVTINAVARTVAKDLALNNEPPDIPGTGLGSQTYSEIVHKAQTESGWFHVWMCSTRTFVGVQNSNQPRYTTDINHIENGFKFPKCTVAEPQLGPYNSSGKDQYDAGGNAPDTVTLITFYNYPLITPLEWLFSNAGQHPGFIQLQASRTIVNECMCEAKVINLTNSTLPSPSTPASTSTP